MTKLLPSMFKLNEDEKLKQEKVNEATRKSIRNYPEAIWCRSTGSGVKKVSEPNNNFIFKMCKRNLS